MKTGAQIIGDVAAGQTFREAAKTRIVDTVNEGINKLIPTEEAQSGSGKRRRRAATRTRTNKRHQHHHVHRQAAKKRRQIDIFT
jgi:hypothetical protein